MRDLAECAGGIVVTDARELILLEELHKHLVDWPVDVVSQALGGNVLRREGGNECMGATTVAGDEVLEELFDSGFEMHGSVFLRVVRRVGVGVRVASGDPAPTRHGGEISFVMEHLPRVMDQFRGASASEKPPTIV
jgi:hypothetical protein